MSRRLRHEVESECLRDALVALEGMTRSSYDPDRYAAQAAVAEIEQKLGGAVEPELLVPLSRRDAEILVAQRKNIRPSDLGLARAPIRDALSAARGAVGS